MKIEFLKKHKMHGRDYQKGYQMIVHRDTGKELIDGKVAKLVTDNPEEWGGIDPELQKEADKRK